MKLILLIFFFFFQTRVHAQIYSMRRCTLLPVIDEHLQSDLAFKVYNKIEKYLKTSSWCTYNSNAEIMDIFSKYRTHLSQHLKSPEVLNLVAEKLKVGSIILLKISPANEGNSLVEIMIYGEGGEDTYFSERTYLDRASSDAIEGVVRNWLEVYAQFIPYDGRISGILGDQVVIGTGKGYSIKEKQSFIVLRPKKIKRHPLLKKVVDWETETIGYGKVSSISENQSLGLIYSYKPLERTVVGDWIKLEKKDSTVLSLDPLKEKMDNEPGKLGIVSAYLYGGKSVLNNSKVSGLETESNRMTGLGFGIDTRLEAWITRDYFSLFKFSKATGTLSKSAGNPAKKQISSNYTSWLLSGGYKYLPLGYFYGPQINFFAGFMKSTFDFDLSVNDGFSKMFISGIAFGTSANIPVSRELRMFTQAEIIPFPVFRDEQGLYGRSKNGSSMRLEFGVKYQYTIKVSLDAMIEIFANKAKFTNSSLGFQEASMREDRFKAGMTFNF